MYIWQDEEQGELCRKFAQFVDSWEYDEDVKCLNYERSYRVTLIDMSVNGERFSFRKCGHKFTILFDEKVEFIKKETFDFFEGVCLRFIEDTAQVDELGVN